MLDEETTHQQNVEVTLPDHTLSSWCFPLLLSVANLSNKPFLLLHLVLLIAPVRSPMYHPPLGQILGLPPGPHYMCPPAPVTFSTRLLARMISDISQIMSFPPLAWLLSLHPVPCHILSARFSPQHQLCSLSFLPDVERFLSLSCSLYLPVISFPDKLCLYLVVVSVHSV